MKEKSISHVVFVISNQSYCNYYTLTSSANKYRQAYFVILSITNRITWVILQTLVTLCHSYSGKIEVKWEWAGLIARRTDER